MTRRWITLGVIFGAACLAVLGCSTAQTSNPAPLPEVPEYTRLTHPPGSLETDLRAWYETMSASESTNLENCADPFFRLSELSSSVEEIAKGTEELIGQDAAKAHNCFYVQLELVSRLVNSDKTIQERQKQVVKVYSYLAAAARAFRDRFHDTRYQRWAMASYKRHSERVFFRTLEQTPEATADLVLDSNSDYTYYVQDRKPGSAVLEKYGLVEKTAEPEAALAPIPLEESPAAPDVFTP